MATLDWPKCPAAERLPEWLDLTGEQVSAETDFAAYHLEVPLPH